MLALDSRSNEMAFPSPRLAPLPLGRREGGEEDLDRDDREWVEVPLDLGIGANSSVWMASLCGIWYVVTALPNCCIIFRRSYT